MANLLDCAACDSSSTVGHGAHEQYEGQEHRSMQDVDIISAMCTLLMRGNAAGEIMIEVLVAAAAIASNATTATTAAAFVPTCSACSSPNLCLLVNKTNSTDYSCDLRNKFNNCDGRDGFHVEYCNEGTSTWGIIALIVFVVLLVLTTIYFSNNGGRHGKGYYQSSLWLFVAIRWLLEKIFCCCTTKEPHFRMIPKLTGNNIVDAQFENALRSANYVDPKTMANAKQMAQENATALNAGQRALTYNVNQYFPQPQAGQQQFGAVQPSAPPHEAVPMAAAIVQVEVPKGMNPNDTFEFVYNGKRYTYTVPRGHVPGQTIEVPIQQLKSMPTGGFKF